MKKNYKQLYKEEKIAHESLWGTLGEITEQRQILLNLIDKQDLFKEVLKLKEREKKSETKKI